MATGSTGPLTRAEVTRYHETSRHADVMRFIAELSNRGDQRLVVQSFGVSLRAATYPFLFSRLMES